MAYSASILTRAEARLKQAQRAHQQDQARRRAEIYRALPRTAEIDRQLRQTAPRILAAALRQGLGQEEALATLRRENLALQDEEAALLDQAGYPPDALEETPYCPLCNDRGWRGAAMCDCLEGPVPPGADRGALLPAGPGGSVLRHLPPGLLRPADLAGVPPLSPGEHGVYPLLLPQLRGEL